MNVFTAFALLSCYLVPIYAYRVKLGILHYEETDPLNSEVLERIDRYYKRQGNQPLVNFRESHISDILSANTTLCELTAQGIIALVGPTFQPVAPILQSICANLEIPYIEYMWKPVSIPQKMTANFFPESQLLAKGIAALVVAMDWKSFTVLYETLDGLTKLRDVLKISVPEDLPVIFKQIHPSDDYRTIFKQVKNYTENTIIIDCELERVMPILLAAKEVKMLEFLNNYFLANLDAHSLNFSVLNTKANITTISLLNTSSPILHHAVKDWNDGRLDQIKPEEVRAEQAILHDAVYFFMRRFYELKNVDHHAGFVSESLFCNQTKILQTGFRMYKYLISKSEEVGEALTAPIRFDEFGRRVDFNLYAVEIIQGNKQVIADWNPSMNDAIHFRRNFSEQMQAAVQNLRKVEVIVASRLVAPYLFAVGDAESGNQTFEGFAYDVVDEIARDMNFTFRFEIYKDYGKYDPATKTWDGILGALLDRQAHMAIGDLTITEYRRSLVDFTLPFMNLGVSILHRKPNVAADANKFAFMDPFDFEVWVYTVTLYLIISSALYVICRFAPGDWENPHACDPEPEELENIWGLKNCFWLTLGSIMTQGCDILPKGVSSRMGTSMWWFFSLIMTSSYTANLAAFLTKERMETTITGAEDLAKQTKIKYGTVLNGATMAFFKNSNFSTYSRLWANMEQAKPTVFERSNDDGVKRVLTTKNQYFAFFMESSSIEYEVEKNCNLKQVGSRLDEKGYGIAMPMNAPYRGAIDQKILLYQERGKLSDLKKKWWKDKVKKETTCKVVRPEDIGGEVESNELALDNVGGVFIVLWVGVSLAFALASAEFLWNVQQVAVEEHITYWEALAVELKFAVKVWITKKKAKPVLSDSSSHVSDTRSIAEKVLKTAGSFINLDVFERLSTGKNKN